MPDTDRLRIKKGFSKNPDPFEAIKEIKERIDQPDISVVILFCSSNYDFKILGQEIENNIPGTIIGCSTSGEISTLGYQYGSISAVSIASNELEISSFFIDDIQQFGFEDAEAIGANLNLKKTKDLESGKKYKKFGLFLIDGLSCLEEKMIAYLYGATSDIPIIGGSAGDDLKFTETFIYHDGEFISGSAIYTVFHTSISFYPFKTQHFVPSEKKMVITEADPSRRIVYEINGEPAAMEYARLVGLEVDNLKAEHFSEHPVMLKLGGEYYVRSIQKLNDDGSLSFFCAIDEGLVLTIAKGVDFIENLHSIFEDVKKNIPNPQLIICFDCILRRIEMFQEGLEKDAAKIMKQNNAIGFSTYGEQFNGIHVNQTLTGIALGS